MQLGVMLTLWLLVWGFDLSGDCCERPPWQRVFCPKCYSGCPRYDDGLVRLGRTLRSRLVGQADAIDVIATAFARPPAAHGVRSLLFIGYADTRCLPPPTSRCTNDRSTDVVIAAATTESERPPLHTPSERHCSRSRRRTLAVAAV